MTNLLNDHSGKLSFGRVMMFVMFIVALFFFGKAWWTWDSIPDGVIAGISSLSGALAAWIKVTQLIDSKSNAEIISRKGDIH